MHLDAVKGGGVDPEGREPNAGEGEWVRDRAVGRLIDFSANLRSSLRYKKKGWFGVR